MNSLRRVFGTPGWSRTSGLSLRSAKKRSPSLPANVPQVLDITWFLTIFTVRISLQNTPVSPQCR